jgi:AcrR family transcriptional regulator
MTGPRPRRTQEERSAQTRARLIQAALDELMEQGYAGLTTAAIADRAEVSRGALTHHFGSKEDLVVQAVEHMLQEATAEIRALADAVAGRRLALDAFLDRLWEMFRGRLLLVTLEHVTAARHSPTLKQRLVPVVREFHGALDAIWRDFFRASGLPPAEIETSLNATLCLLRGMGVQTVLREDPAYYAGLIAWWKAELAKLMRPPASSPRIRVL